MLRTSWLVFLLMGLASTLAFADGRVTTDELLVTPNLAIQNVCGDEAPDNSSRQVSWNVPVVQYRQFLAGHPGKPKHHKDPDAVPENWGLSDVLGFSALALLAFAVLTHLKVLRPFVA
jgi:hypothetical protein